MMKRERKRQSQNKVRGRMKRKKMRERKDHLVEMNVVVSSVWCDQVCERVHVEVVCHRCVRGRLN